jgi:hypothetical protein
MAIVMDDFKVWCGFMSVQGAIDGMHISIIKPILFPKNYYYHKLGGYSLVAQAIVNCKKRLIDVFVGLPRNVNDSRVPYLLGDKCLDHDPIQGRRLTYYFGIIEHEAQARTLCCGESKDFQGILYQI